MDAIVSYVYGEASLVLQGNLTAKVSEQAEMFCIYWYADAGARAPVPGPRQCL